MSDRDKIACSGCGHTRFQTKNKKTFRCNKSVSYTHLTLPTILLV